MVGVLHRKGPTWVVEPFTIRTFPNGLELVSFDGVSIVVLSLERELSGEVALCLQGSEAASSLLKAVELGMARFVSREVVGVLYDVALNCY